MKQSLTLLLMLSISLNACSFFKVNGPARESATPDTPVQQSAARQANPNETWINWDSRLVFAKGRSPRIQAASDAQSRMMTERAAYADAVRKLAAAVYGLHIDEQRTVDQFGREYNTVSQRVEGVLVNAQRVDLPQYFSDGSIEITVAIPIANIEQALDQKVLQR